MKKNCVLQNEKLSTIKKGLANLKGQLCKETTSVVLEATGVYSKQIDIFFKTERIWYCILNPLSAKKQTDGLRGNKKCKVDVHKLVQSHYRFDREKKESSDLNLFRDT